MAQCGQWFRMNSKLVALRSGKNEGNDEISKAKRMYKEDERMHRLMVEEYGGAGQVLNKIRLFDHGGDARQGEISKAELHDHPRQRKRVETESRKSLSPKVTEPGSRSRTRVPYVDSEDQQRRQVAFDVTRRLLQRQAAVVA